MTNGPLPRRVTTDGFSRAVTDVLDLVSDRDRKRLVDHLKRYSSLRNAELCWVERTFNQARPRLSAASRSVLLRAGFGIEP